MSFPDDEPAKTINEKAKAHGYELEHTFMEDIVDTAKKLGVEFIYHTYNSQRSPEGFPDLVLMKTVRGKSVLVFLEVKGVTKGGGSGPLSVRPGKASAAQQAWVDGLKKVEGDVHAAIVYPWQREELTESLLEVFR